MRTRLARAARWILTAWLAGGVCGCGTVEGIGLTGRLWSSSEFTCYRGPSTNGHVQVFHARERDDFLIVYDEVEEGGTQLRRRAFFLNANQARLEARRRPRFVNPTKAATLQEVDAAGPSIPADQPAPARRQVELSLDGRQVAVKDPDGGTLRFELPSYPGPDRWGALVLLTPLTLTADLAFVGILVDIGVRNHRAYRASRVGR